MIVMKKSLLLIDINLIPSANLFTKYINEFIVEYANKKFDPLMGCIIFKLTFFQKKYHQEMVYIYPYEQNDFSFNRIYELSQKLSNSKDTMCILIQEIE